MARLNNKNLRTKRNRNRNRHQIVFRIRAVKRRPENMAPRGYANAQNLVLYDLENNGVDRSLARTLGPQMSAFMNAHGYNGKVIIHVIVGGLKEIDGNLDALLKEGGIRFRQAVSKKEETADDKLKQLLKQFKEEDKKAGRRPGTIVMISSDAGFGKVMGKAKEEGYNVMLVYDPNQHTPGDPDQHRPGEPPYLTQGSSICPFNDFISKDQPYIN